MIPTTWQFPVNFTPKNYTSKLIFEKKNFRFAKVVSGSVSKSRKRPFWDVGRNFFFSGKKSWLLCFLGWNSLEITVILQSFRHYFGITVKIRKIRIFHRFFYFWPWSRNNYVMIPTTWSLPVNFTPKNYSSKLNFQKKKFRFPKVVSGSVSKSRKRPFWDVRRNFFFLEKKVDYGVFLGEIHWRLPWSCNHFNMISVSQSKFEKSEFFIVFSTFDRDHEIIMWWFQRHGNSR